MVPNAPDAQGIVPGAFRGQTTKRIGGAPFNYIGPASPTSGMDQTRSDWGREGVWVGLQTTP